MSQQSQSPINLQPRITAAEKLKLNLHWQLMDGTVHRGEHGLEVTFPPSKNNYASLDGKRFLLRGLHFHNPSEHYLDSRQFDGELHIVNQNLDDLSYLVVGIFLQIKKEDDAEPNQLQDFADALGRENTPAPCLPSEWLPKSAIQILRYEGSLTTPPYSETVSWAIVNRSKKISQCVFDKIFLDSEPHARSLQDLNRRYVVAYDWKKRRDE